MLSTLSIVKRNKLHLHFCQRLRFLKRWSHSLIWSENLGELKTNPRSRLFPLKTNPRWSTPGARGFNSGAQSPGECSYRENIIIWYVHNFASFGRCNINSKIRKEKKSVPLPIFINIFSCFGEQSFPDQLDNVWATQASPVPKSNIMTYFCNMMSILPFLWKHCSIGFAKNS